MTTILNPTITLLQTKIKKSPHKNTPSIRSLLSDDVNQNQICCNRRKFIGSALLLGGVGLNSVTCLPLKAQAQESKWGTRSFIWEKYFEPGLSPEDAVSRIQNTAQGLHGLRHMLETMSWRYVIFYIRLKQAYLRQDMKSAMVMVPQPRRNDYVNAANELVDNMAEFDYYVRTPKIYESFVCYEKTLKSMDNLLTFLA
ncbi:Photosynthetic NDH subunit of lumenal location 2 chloroplastic [Bienertia sinuspersici]